MGARKMSDFATSRYNSYLKRLRNRVDAGALKPIHMHVFEGLEQGAVLSAELTLNPNPQT